MVDVGNKIELSGQVVETDAGKFTVELREIFVDNEWKLIDPVKTVDFATTDYNESLTPQELAIVKQLADKYKEQQGICQREKVLLQSIASKLKEV